MNLVDNVVEFHNKYVPEKFAKNGISTIEPAELAFRVSFLDEELAELKEAISIGDEAGELDAYVDLCWVAIGSALMRFGKQAFDYACEEVYEANMNKVRLDGDFKIRKPEGWKSPDIQNVINHVRNLKN